MGFGLGDRARRNERELRAFLANPVVEILAVDAEVARLFGSIAGDLRRRGVPLPTNDIWIAAEYRPLRATVHGLMWLHALKARSRLIGD